MELSPFPVTVTTRIIPFLVGNPYKPSFATVTGKGDNPSYKWSYGAPKKKAENKYVDNPF